MPNLKISALTGGGAAQAADEFVVARSGGNNKITGANVAAAATSVGTLTSLTVSGVTTLSAGTAAAPALTTTGDTNTGLLFPAADVVGIATGGTERMRLDASGNIGIGVTPQAWSTRALEILGGVAISSVTGLDFTLNAYYNAGWLYRSTGAATRYEQASGQHRWYNAPSGTAGNVISFTQAMTLDASGRLMVGTTSPGGLATFSQAQNAATTIAILNADLGLSATSRLALDTAGGANYIETRRNGGVMVFNVNGTDRWQISNAGNLLASADNTYDIGASGATRPRDLFLGRNMVGGGWVRAGAASAGAASTTTIGSTTATTVGATGAASALPANPLGYIVAHVGTTEVRIPYYNA
jgi:hypothetical protein